MPAPATCRPRSSRIHVRRRPRLRNTLEQALDLCDELGDGVGVAIDTYHVWWDPQLFAQIARAGVGKRILAHHICDWLVPTRHMLLDRGMMGDGVIDFRPIRRAIEAAGYTGPQAVEILSETWWRDQRRGAPDHDRALPKSVRD
jgi:sugar phosphate isomerase/epimerase